MIDFAREGNTIYVWDFSRLARSTKDLLELVELMQSKRINLVSVKENLDSSTPTGKLMLTMIGAINEFERANLLERQREGIAIAKAEGKFKGRKDITLLLIQLIGKRYILSGRIEKLIEQRQWIYQDLKRDENINNKWWEKLSDNINKFSFLFVSGRFIGEFESKLERISGLTGVNGAVINVVNLLKLADKLLGGKLTKEEFMKECFNNKEISFK